MAGSRRGEDGAHHGAGYAAIALASSIRRSARIHQQSSEARRIIHMAGRSDDTVIGMRSRNRFDRMEVAGAFGDLGTLIPFVVAYISVLKMDPFGVLFAFGISHGGLRLRLPHADPGAADEGGGRDRHHAGGPDARHHAGHGVAARASRPGSCGSSLGLTGTAHRVAQARQASRRHRHHPRSRLRLHDRRREDDVAELVDRRSGLAWHLAAAHQSRHSGDVLAAPVRCRLRASSAIRRWSTPCAACRSRPRLPTFALAQSDLRMIS